MLLWLPNDVLHEIAQRIPSTYAPFHFPFLLTCRRHHQLIYDRHRGPMPMRAWIHAAGAGLEHYFFERLVRHEKRTKLPKQLIVDAIQGGNMRIYKWVRKKLGGNQLRHLHQHPLKVAILHNRLHILPHLIADPEYMPEMKSIYGNPERSRNIRHLSSYEVCAMADRVEAYRMLKEARATSFEVLQDYRSMVEREIFTKAIEYASMSFLQYLMTEVFVEKEHTCLIFNRLRGQEKVTLRKEDPVACYLLQTCGMMQYFERWVKKTRANVLFLRKIWSLFIACTPPKGNESK